MNIKLHVFKLPTLPPPDNEDYCHIGVYAWGKTNWASNYPALAPYFSALREGPQYLTPTMYAAAIRALQSSQPSSTTRPSAGLEPAPSEHQAQRLYP